jgi:hypothetical protein
VHESSNEKRSARAAGNEPSCIHKLEDFGDATSIHTRGQMKPESRHAIHPTKSRDAVKNRACVHTCRLARKGAFVLAWLSTLAPVALAQVNTSSGKAPLVAASATPARTVLAEGCNQLGPLQAWTGRPTIEGIEAARLQLHQTVSITLSNAQAFARCLLDSKASPVLFIDHRAVEGLPVRVREADADRTRLAVDFDLESSDANVQAWRALQRQGWPTSPADRSVDVGIGAGSAYEVASARQVAVDTALTPLELHLGPVGPCGVWFMLVVSLLLLALMCRATSLARDRTGSRDAVSDDSGRSFSLSRLTLSAWTFTAMSCIAVSWLATASLPNLSSGGFPLLLAASGLSAGLASTIDRVRQTVAAPSANLWSDLVGDAEGVSAHRLQCLVANVFLLYVVWAELLRQGTAANIDKTWALFLGISSGTYILGKTAEPVPQLDAAHDPRPDPFPEG